MKSMRNLQSGDGFTLIELLVAIALLGISVTLVLGIYSSVFSVVEQVDQKTSFQNRSGLLIDQLQRDLYGMYKGKSGFFRAETEPDESGDIPLLEFTTTSQLRFTKPVLSESISLVRYRLEKSRNNQNYNLYRYEYPFLFGAKEEGGPGSIGVLVVSQVAGFRLSFQDRYGSFLDRWEARSSGMNEGPDDDRFPRLVRIELELAESSEKEAKTRTLSHTIGIPTSRYAARTSNEDS